MLSPSSKVKAQSVGRFLSNMVMPNIGAFIAWGLISALFIPSGWLPNEQLAQLVEPMITYLIPLLIATTGGRMVAGERGAVVSAIMTIGLIVGAEIPMLMGAMIMGPIGGYAIKAFDDATKHRVKSGFEMLVNNFSAGIVGMIGAIAAFYLIGPMVLVLSAMLTSGVNVLVETHTLAFVAILVEPAKVLFLNNAINHGIFSPLGIQQAKEIGQSVFFLVESNPGPGLGILLAYAMSSKGQPRQTAAGATIIHFFGGIQEVYFPYVMMKPRLIVALILGSMAGIFTLTLFNVGLVSAASPGSIISILLMTPKASMVGVVASVVVSTLVSFFSALLLLKKKEEKPQAEASHANSNAKVSPIKTADTYGTSQPVLEVSQEQIFLGLEAKTKQEAIQFAGDKLVELGFVNQQYVEGMLKREDVLSTYLGEGIALPHGMIGEKQHVIKTGVVFCQFPKGVAWDNEGSDEASLAIAIAAQGSQHIQVISSVSNALDDNESLTLLKETSNVEDVLAILNRPTVVA